MKRALVALAAVLALAGCGGSTSPQHAYHTRYGLEAHSPTFGVPPKGVPKSLLPTASALPTLGMLDSVSSSTSIFAGLNPVVVAGYTSGSWPTYWDYKGHFKYVVAVMVNAQHYGVHGAARSCLDVEPGDATPSEAGPWDEQEIDLGFVPCDYGSLSEWPAIDQSIRAAGVAISTVDKWDADWTYTYHLDSGYQATQWTDHYANRNIDGSAVSYAFVGKGVTPTKPSVRCYHKGWPVPTSDRTLCLKVRAHDAFLGQQRAKEAAYLKVSDTNLAAIEARIKTESTQESAFNAQLQADLKKFGF